MSCCTPSPRENAFTTVEELEKTACFFKALGHPIRLSIVSMLLEGERCVCELHANSGRDMSTISSHLKSLKAAGVISSEQRGKNIFYSLSCPCINSILGCLQEHLNS